MKMKKGVIIKTSGVCVSIAPKNETDFTCEELNSFVHGAFEILDLRNGTIMVVNEEGKLLGLGINHVATKLAHRNYDVIVGDVLICDSDMVK